MPIIGERITKISAKRGKLERKMEITSNVDLTAVSLKTLGVAAEAKKGLAFSFDFKTTYGKDGGEVGVTGELFFIDKEDKMKEIEAAWKKDKKFDKNIRLSVMNRILELCYMQAIIMVDQVNLPAPMQFPKFVLGNKK